MDIVFSKRFLKDKEKIEVVDLYDPAGTCKHLL